MIYTVDLIDDTAGAGKLYMGESENNWNKL